MFPISPNGILRLRIGAVRRCPRRGASAAIALAGAAVRGLIIAAILGLPHSGAAAGTCGVIDPTGILAGITGDFELSADPDDPQGHVLFISNTTGGVLATQNIVVAQLDGVTGRVVPGSLTVVANNYYGNSNTNGPEWFRSPQGNLGIAYAGGDGVHMAFRAVPPQAWNAFSYDYTGAPTNGSPPPLPNAIAGSYINPPPQPPAEEAQYSSYSGSCTSLCFGNYQGGPTTDVGQVLATQGYSMIYADAAPWDGYIYYSACNATGGGCGVFSAALDGQGGLSQQTLLVSTGKQAARQIAAYRHPVTGVPVLFTPASATTISVWTQTAPAAPLVLLATVPVPTGQSHYRAAASATQVVLNFLVKQSQDPGQGSYTIAVSAGSDGVLSVGPVNQISTLASGAELDWYPAAGSWALVYRRPADGKYLGCWVTP